MKLCNKPKDKRCTDLNIPEILSQLASPDWIEESMAFEKRKRYKLPSCLKGIDNLPESLKPYNSNVLEFNSWG